MLGQFIIKRETVKADNGFFKPNDRVIVQCPTFRAGKRLPATIKGIKPSGIAAFVLIDGNKKAVLMAVCWLNRLTDEL